MSELTVMVVARAHEIWTGRASSAVVPIDDGELGILPAHAPVLAVLGDGVARFTTPDGGRVRARIHGGFLSVDTDRVTVVTDRGELLEDAKPTGTGR